MSEWKKAGAIVDSTSVRWKKEGDDTKSKYFGDTVSGVLVAKKEDVGPNASKLYEIESEEHGRLAVWGGLTALDNGMEEVSVGQEVQITHQGMQKTKDGKGEYRGFEVLYRDAPMKKANTLPEEEELPEM